MTVRQCADSAVIAVSDLSKVGPLQNLKTNSRKEEGERRGRGAQALRDGQKVQINAILTVERSAQRTPAAADSRDNPEQHHAWRFCEPWRERQDLPHIFCRGRRSSLGNPTASSQSCRAVAPGGAAWSRRPTTGARRTATRTRPWTAPTTSSQRTRPGTAGWPPASAAPEADSPTTTLQNYFSTDGGAIDRDLRASGGRAAILTPGVWTAGFTF